MNSNLLPHGFSPSSAPKIFEALARPRSHFKMWSRMLPSERDRDRSSRPVYGGPYDSELSRASTLLNLFVMTRSFAEPSVILR